ncbi:hypothetical protein F909_01754 [Acinetobacter sp. ANC 3929]|uniref:putative pilus system protein FilF n=1 Tax=unclassified Acinetobacter TaxID=196816 RepID=UPI0002CEBF5F|nr:MULTISPECIES: hypothetical protein [unclassified Acinetobacter]ENW82061.1 hypothetical protein F909_01754 [Acinetobacter sp. ANC 3929]MCH7352603.1 hypothetical protein [Acinetobacter sp. NIPH 2023]MCH7356649.1 hypothetical protein [Acinetobacter sp. NIPH 1958]MCH7360071.1 hypothetical protein [Acinetobacter sp. NIPH 2024]
MDKKILLPFTLSALTLILNGCGGESSKIKEDPSRGIGVTSSTSCDIKASDCLLFVMDYPVAGLNFDCSSDTVNHFVTKVDSNSVSGACKIGDTVSFYIQGESAKKISLGAVKLDSIAKLKMATPPFIRLLDIAMGATGKAPASLSMNDDTIKVAMGLVKIFQAIGVEQNSNFIGDIQPTEITKEKRDQLKDITKNVGSTEFISGEYINILKPWLDLNQITDETAFRLLIQSINLSNTGVWQAELPVLKPGGSGLGNINVALPDGFFGCNKEDYFTCVTDKTNLLHSMGNFYLLSDRQGYIFGYGQQWRGPATIVNNIVREPYVLTTKVKPRKMQLNAQSNWFNPIIQAINTDQKINLSLSGNSAENLSIKQGKIINGNTIAGTAGLYRSVMGLKETDTVDDALLGMWEQRIDNQLYKGRIDILRFSPASYLSKDIFKTEQNVDIQQKYIFPLYATLTVKFADAKFEPVDIGIVIDEHGDIRTDIKASATATDKSGICGTVKSINTDGTITDSNNQIQYRIGTTAATEFSTADKSITVRMILSNPTFGLADGVLFGLNLSEGTGAKINVHNLLAGQPSGINLTNFQNNTVVWSNTYAIQQSIYNSAYDKLTDKTGYIAPTDDERELAKRYSGTVTIKVADQKIPACNAIKTKV